MKAGERERERERERGKRADVATPTTSAARLPPLASLTKGGVLLTSAPLRAGWPRSTLTRTLRAEGWTSLRNGAWAEPGHTPDLVTRLHTEQLIEPRLIVSHRSAAALWLIETLTPRSTPPLDFIDPRLGHRPKVRGVKVHRLPLLPQDVTERRGLRVTTPARTLADLLRTGPRDAALVAVDSALTRRRVGSVRRAPLTTHPALTAALDTDARGTVRARTWLALADPGAGSPAETIARLRMYDADLHPESQAELRTPDGRRRFLDFLFRAEGLGVEIEGYAYHGTRAAHRDDVARFNQLQQCPEVRTLLRFTAEDVFHRPAQIIAQIDSALRRTR
ncbi:hypothetical protein [Streptomyces sp. NPDC006997]|uniref:hypothetical protein n=1 Tax=Streptomyces sp. NPDC006997 TaxID=3155356 RepID=UPI0033EED6B1